MRNISHIAPGVMAGSNVRTVLYQNGNTQDIITAIMYADKTAVGYVKDFAQTLKGSSIKATASNIWHWIKKNVKYKLDPSLEQWIKTPAQTITDGYADCKSYSILAGALFRSIYPTTPVYYRFASYSSSPTVTHVYVVVKPQGATPIIIDDVLPHFNTEKPYTHKQDHRMTQISYIQGIGNTSADDEKYRVPLGTAEDWAKGTLTDADLDLAIYRDKVKTEMDVVSGMGSFGWAKSKKYGALLKKIDATRAAVAKHKRRARIHGIGSADSQLEQDFRDIASDVSGIGKTKLGKFFKKVANGAKKVAKAVVKVATAPMRLATKGMLEVALPKAAPFFKYLFISNPGTIAKLPAKVKAKRKKAEFFADFIVNTIGMKRPHFMGIIRNGFVKRYGKSPETVLASELKGMPITGIGFIGDIAKLLTELLSLIGKLFKKKTPPVSNDDAPSADDFAGMSDAEASAMASSIKQSSGPEYVDPDFEKNSTGGNPTGRAKTGIC